MRFSCAPRRTEEEQPGNIRCRLSQHIGGVNQNDLAFFKCRDVNVIEAY